MTAAIRCPHCKAELPEKASFCARCGRRIEGWSLPAGAPPDAGEPSLPGGEEATRQMEPTPSLLRAAAVSVERKRRRKRSPLPLVVAMLVVAAAGAIGGFFVVRSRLSAASHPRSATPEATAEPVAPGVPAAAAAATSATARPSVAVAGSIAAAGPAAPKTLVRKSKSGTRAHVLAAAPVAVKARKTVAGGLPHKQVATDSKSLALPTVQHETAAAAAPPPSEAEEKQQAEAGIDGDSVRLVVGQHLGQVRACYGRAFKDASPGGTVELGFAIDPTGRARNVRTETNTTDSAALAHCLEARVREWQFPRPVGGDYELIYPFVFTPGS